MFDLRSFVVFIQRKLLAIRYWLLWIRVLEKMAEPPDTNTPEIESTGNLDMTGSPFHGFFGNFSRQVQNYVEVVNLSFFQILQISCKDLCILNERA